MNTQTNEQEEDKLNLIRFEKLKRLKEAEEKKRKSLHFYFFKRHHTNGNYVFSLRTRKHLWNKRSSVDQRNMGKTRTILLRNF